MKSEQCLIAGKITYSASSLEDIAKYFDGFVDSAKRRANTEKTARERVLAAREAYCWSEAARILRATEFKQVETG